MRVAPMRTWTEVVVDYLILTKPEISFLMLATVLAGCYLGAGGRPDFFVLANTLIGTALVVGGGSALNMVVERDADSLMLRTRTRPIPAGRVPVRSAFRFGTVATLVGVAYLAVTVHWLVAALAALGVANYLFVYTPLKLVGPGCTLVGAVSGAIPPLLGWAAVTGGVGAGAWILFGLLFTWQLPHFLAIAWMYREDYARGGFRMLPVVEPDGASTGRHVLWWTAMLVVISLVPVRMGLVGRGYAIAAAVLGVGVLAAGIGLVRMKTYAAARWLFIASMVYLPALLTALACCWGTA